MKYPLSKQIYDLIELHRNGQKIRGTEATLRKMKSGDLNPTLKTVAEILKENEMPAELVIIVKQEGKKGKKKIRL